MRSRASSTRYLTDNTATVFLAAEELLRLVRERGVAAEVAAFD